VAKSLYRAENLQLAALLRELREGCGLVQADLGARLGRGQTYVSNVELAIKRLDLVELRDYCAGLGIELRDLIERWEKGLRSSEAGRRRRSK
jgi:transcriptional regulator with XRE-family HTH domain